MITWITIVFGLCWGSFLSVIKNRLDRLGTILYTRSECPNCKTKLSALDLVPILSFVLMGGKCRHCHKKISIEYPLFEIASLALTLGVYLRFGISIFSVALFLSLSCLLVASALDIESMEVELGIFIAGIVFALIWYFGSNGLSLSSAALLGWAILLAVFLPLVFYLVSHEKWMGLGDAIFALWAAILVGFPLSGVAMFCAFVSGAIFGIIMIVMRKRDAKVGIPFGPFIALGAIIALFWGNIILDAYLKIIGF